MASPPTTSARTATNWFIVRPAPEAAAAERRPLPERRRRFPRSSWSTPTASRRKRGREDSTSNYHVSGAQRGVQADLLRGLEKSARLSVRPQHAWGRLAAHEGNVRAVAALRESPRRFELSARHDGIGDRHRALLRAGRRYALGASLARRPAGGGFHHRQRQI